MKPTLTLFLTLLFQWFLLTPAKAEVDCYHDYVAPVAVCDAHIVVSLSNNGTAKLYATDIDDGSHDNCQIVEYKARRMVAGWCPPGVADDTQFRPYVEFCCADVGAPIWVVLRVVDAHGNYNECMAEVTVQDYHNPHLVCPPNITVSCSFWFSHDALYNPNNRTFGTIAVNGAPRLPIIINDPGNYHQYQPYNWGLDGYYGGSNCGGYGGGNPWVWVSIPEVIDYRNSCGVGVIKRKFYVESGYYSDWCWQTITVKDYSHGYYNISWPWDYTADGCQYGPDDVKPDWLPHGYDKPVINGSGGACSLIGHAYDDLVFTFSDGACYKILREWTVIDWCKYEPNNHYSPGIWKHTQVIKLMNNVGPYFPGGCHDREVPGYEPNCSGRYHEYLDVHDDCTPNENLKWDYKIDLWHDGTFDISYAGTGAPFVNKVLPNGWHKILWNVSDQCGNYSTCAYKLHVVDKKAPTPVCYYGLSSVVMPIGGMVTIWAKDFNASSYDNCTPPYKLKYSFSENPWEASRTFTCDDLGTVPIQVWVHDEYGNKDYCTTFIKINDNEDACGGMNLISGEVETFTNIPVPQSSASLFKIMPDQSLKADESNDMSDATGHFTLGFGTTQYDRMVKLSKPGKKLEGITTLDMITLQRHISGEEPIIEPHKLYAADLDGSGRIGANDLLLLKNALLGAYKSTAYKGNLNWAFFGNPCEPHAPLDLLNQSCYFSVEVDHVGTFPKTVSFKAVKMGDVNADLANIGWALTPRTNSSVEFQVIERNGILEVAAGRDMELYGFQFSLKATGLVLEEGVVGVNGQHMATDADGMTHISWGQKIASTVKKGEVLFTLGNMPSGFSISDLLINTEDGLIAEAYTENLRTESLTFGVAAEDVVEDRFETMVSPNPFSDQTRLFIIHPVGSEYTVAIYDMKGVEVFAQAYKPLTANSEIVITPDMIKTPGLYYYRVKSDRGELSGKFIRQ